MHLSPTPRINLITRPGIKKGFFLKSKIVGMPLHVSLSSIRWHYTIKCHLDNFTGQIPRCCRSPLTTFTVSAAFYLRHIAFCSIWYFRLGVKYIEVSWRIICGFWSSRMFLLTPGFNFYFRVAWAHSGPMQSSVLPFHQVRNTRHSWKVPKKITPVVILTDLQSFTRNTQKSQLSGHNILL